MASGVEESLLFCYSSNCFAARVTLYIVVFFFFFCCTAQLGESSYTARDQAYAPCSGSMDSLTPGPPGKSPTLPFNPLPSILVLKSLL